jgi:hypothetical protein
LKRRDSLEKMGQSCTGRLDLSALTVTIFSIIVRMQSCGLEFRHIILCDQRDQQISSNYDFDKFFPVVEVALSTMFVQVFK